MIRLVIFLSLFVVAGIGCSRPTTPTQGIVPPAKNVMLFVGDGMGISTIIAARILDGQSCGQSSEENLLSFEYFPNIALAKTYNSNQQAPASAGTASVIHTKTKTRAGVISVGPRAKQRDCLEAEDNRLTTLGEIAKSHGDSLGVVTSTRVTHAMLATVYHTLLKGDGKVIGRCPWNSGCVDIAKRLVEFNVSGGFDVILGGGKRELLSADLHSL